MYSNLLRETMASTPSAYVLMSLLSSSSTSMPGRTSNLFKSEYDLFPRKLFVIPVCFLPLPRINVLINAINTEIKAEPILQAHRFQKLYNARYLCSIYVNFIQVTHISIRVHLILNLFFLTLIFVWSPVKFDSSHSDFQTYYD